MSGSRGVLITVLLVSLLVLISATAAAGIDIRRSPGPIAVDGRIDEAAWHSIAPLPLSQVTPSPGSSLRVALRPSLTLSKRLSIGGYYQLNAIRFADRGQSVDIHLARLRLRYAVTDKLFADLFSQYSNLDQTVSGNLRLRYCFREGTDLYVVLNETTRTDLLEDGLELPRTSGRSLLVKYSQTFSF